MNKSINSSGDAFQSLNELYAATYYHFATVWFVTGYLSSYLLYYLLHSLLLLLLLLPLPLPLPLIRKTGHKTIHDCSDVLNMVKAECVNVCISLFSITPFYSLLFSITLSLLSTLLSTLSITITVYPPIYSCVYREQAQFCRDSSQRRILDSHNYECDGCITGINGMMR